MLKTASKTDLLYTSLFYLLYVRLLHCRVALLTAYDLRVMSVVHIRIYICIYCLKPRFYALFLLYQFIS